MPLTFHPKPGTVVFCDFTTGFLAPEMVKRRPVVIVSPMFRNRPQLCTIVPLSTTQPEPEEAYHHLLSQGAYPPAGTSLVWAKCDMLATVTLARLDRIKTNRRQFETYTLPKADMHAIRCGILCALGLDQLTDHL